MSTTPAINTKLRISSRIFVKIRSGPNWIRRGPGETDSWKKPELEISCQTPFILFDNIFSYLPPNQQGEIRIRKNP